MSLTIFLKIFIYLFSAGQSLCCYVSLSLVVASGGFCLAAVHGLLIMVVSLVVAGESSGNPFQYSCLENPMDRGAWVGWSPWGREESDMTEQLHFHFSLSRIGQENGNPLQCSCLENPRDGEAWWAAVYGVAQSRTRLKRLSSSDSTWFWGTAKFENPWIHGSLGFWGAWWKWLMEEHEAKHHHITVMMTGAKLSRGYGKETNLGKHA